MAFEKSYHAAEPVTGPACIHLRNKAMCVTGDRKSLDTSGNCWCNLTQHVRGPDQQYVDRQSCTSQRSCFRDSC